MSDDPIRAFFQDAPPFEEAYRAASEGVVAIARFDRHRIRAGGKDRESFLHNMLTQDVMKLPIGSGAAAAFLTSKGKLVADMHVFKDEDCLFLETDASRCAPLSGALSRYVISEDVTLEELSGIVSTFSIEGPLASRLLADLTTSDRSTLEDLEHLSFLRTEFEAVPVVMHAHRRERTPRFDVTVPTAHLVAILAAAGERGQDLGMVPGGAQVAETRRIEAGIPRFGVDMDESHLPLEAGLDVALSLDKGCYIGQEYVVRLLHRGHLNRRLSGIRVEGDEVPEARSAILGDGGRIGEVTSACYSPGLRSVLALGYVRREHFEPGTAVTIETPRGRSPGRVSSLPFFGVDS